MLLLEKVFCSHGVWSALPLEAKEEKEEGAGAVGSSTACAKGKKKSRTKGKQLYFSSSIKVVRGLACSSVISTNGHVKWGAAADQS